MSGGGGADGAGVSAPIDGSAAGGDVPSSLADGVLGWPSSLIMVLCRLVVRSSDRDGEPQEVTIRRNRPSRVMRSGQRQTSGRRTGKSARLHDRGDPGRLHIDAEALLVTAISLRSELSGITLPFSAPSTETSRHSAATAVQQLDDYIVPRLSSLDAPALAVIGGSTGAGKSTLVNSIIGAYVTRPGVLRPTTTAGAGASPGRRRRFRGGPRARRAGEGQRQRCHRCGRVGDRGVDNAVGRPGHPRCPRHRLGGQPEPAAGRPVARSRRSVGVRHHRRPLRRCGALAVPS